MLFRTRYQDLQSLPARGPSLFPSADRISWQLSSLSTDFLCGCSVKEQSKEMRRATMQGATFNDFCPDSGRPAVKKSNEALYETTLLDEYRYCIGSQSFGTGIFGHTFIANGPEWPMMIGNQMYAKYRYYAQLIYASDRPSSALAHSRKDLLSNGLGLPWASKALNMSCIHSICDAQHM